MADIDFSNLASIDMSQFTFAYLPFGTLVTANSTTLEWTFNNDTSSLTLTGTGLVPVVTGGKLSDITAGTFTGMQSTFGDRLNFTMTEANLSAVHFYDLIAAAQWITLRNYTLSGNDSIIGTAGADTMLGGIGADTIRANGGTDSLVGGAGNDVLAGGLGNDTLTGGLGADQFVFNTHPNGATNSDRITDFTHGVDHIALAHLSFPALGGAGPLAAAEFTTSAPTTAAQHVLYSAATGFLSYDSDGSGPIAAVHFAHVTPGLTLTASDFLVI